MKIQQILSEVDLIIIGAGPAGLSGAKKALELQKKVLLVDWGMHTFPHFSAHLSSETHYTTGGIGGTAREWGGQFGLLSERDIYNWQTKSHFNDDFFLELNEEISKLIFEFGEDASTVQLAVPQEKLSQSTQKKETFTLLPKESDIRVIFRETLDHPNLIFVDNKKLLFIENIGIQEARIHFLDEIVENSKIPILLALGCMETTKVLYSSLVRNEAPIPKKLGSNLADHPWREGKIYKNVGLLGKTPPELFTNNKKRKFEYSKYLENEGIYHSGIFEIRRSVEQINPNPFSGLFYKPTNLIAFFLILFQMKESSRRIRSQYQTWIQIEQYSHLESKILFSEEGTFAKCQLSEYDRQLFEEIENWADSIMENYSVKRIRLKQRLIDSKANQAYHPSGTIPVGSDKQECSVDHHGKVFFVRNTWLASSAMFPTASWINPSLVIMATSALIVRNIFRNER